ncbi:hypothetical protein GCM10027599_24170 [Yimella radicis]
MTNRPTTSLTASSLLGTMPATFGIHLIDAATVTALDAGNRVIGTARFDLDEAGTPDDFAEYTIRLIETFRTHGDVRRLLVALWNPTNTETDPAAHAIEAGALPCGIDTDTYVVTGQTFQDCTTGEVVPLAGDDDPHVMRTRVQTGAPVAVEELRAAWTGQGTLAPATSTDRIEAVTTFLLMIEGNRVEDDQLAGLATALTDLALRDALLADNHKDVVALSTPIREAGDKVGYPVIVEALRQAGSRMATGHRAPFWTIAGIIAHGSPNTVPGATVQIALHAAQGDDPDYKLATWASLAIARGFDF